MKKLIMTPFFLLGALLLVGCYKDDLAEFKSIKAIEIEEDVAAPGIYQTLTNSFYVPIPLKFTLSDTASIELPQQDSAGFIIDKVIFKGITENKYPDAGVFRMIFLDSLGVPKDTLPSAPDTWDIDAAPGDGSIVKNNFSLTVDTARYNNLSQYSKVILQLEINSGVNGIPGSYNNLDFTYFVGVRVAGRVKAEL